MEKPIWKAILPALSCRLFPAILATALCACSDDAEVRWEFTSTTSENGTRRGARGEINIVITDAPRPDLAAFFLTIRRVDLLGENRKVYRVYDGPDGHRIDLHSLREQNSRRFFELLVSRAELPEGRYRRLRLQVLDPEVRLLDGSVFRHAAIQLAGGGFIEISLAEPLAVQAGNVSNLVIDFLVDRSLVDLGAPAGQPAWRFQPVVSVEPFPGSLGDRIRTPLRVSGRIDDFDRDGARFVLRLSAGRGSLEILLRADTDLLDPLLDPGQSPADWSSLQPGDPVSVQGQCGPDGGLEALLVLVGG